MRGSSRRKRVSWATDVNLCQVRLFLSDEAPCQVGIGIQDNLQAKASSHLHPSANASEGNLPPGFEGSQPSNPSKNVVFEVPIIRWIRPPKFAMNVDWVVVSGEESQEVEAENQRGMRVFEAVYPRPSSIPPNAAVAADVVETSNDHRQPPIIPITSADDEDTVLGTQYYTMPPMHTSYQSPVKASGYFPTPLYASHSVASTSSSDSMAAVISPGIEPNVAAAASAAYTAILKTNELGDHIDQDLLVQILSNPGSIEKLLNGYANSLQVPPQQTFPPVNHSNPPPTHISRSESSTPSLAASSVNGRFYPQQTNVLQRPSSAEPSVSASAPPSRDFDYYKSLIQKHGEDRQEAPQQFGPRSHSQYGNNQEQQQRYNPQPRGRDSSRPKSMKPCMFFNAPRGCKNGANCSFQHDTSYQPRVNHNLPDSKRMKMDREITGA